MTRRRSLRDLLNNKTTEPSTALPWPDPASQRHEPVRADVQQNYRIAAHLWKDCEDVQFRWIKAGTKDILVVWIDTLVGKELTQNGIFKELSQQEHTPTSMAEIELVLTVQSMRVTSFYEVNLSMGDGFAVLFAEGFDTALCIDVSQFQGRPVEKPDLEPGVVGPQESFTELLEKNLGMLRRKIKSPQFKIEMQHFGNLSQTKVAVIYAAEVAKPELVEELRQRLGKINIDGVVDINYIRELTADAPRSPFPRNQISERPDRIAAALLQGRVGVIVDGSPYAMLVPATFIHLLSSSEDYYSAYIMSLPVRLLRHLTYWASMLLPALYIALMSYHQEMLPTALLVTLAATHEGVPFPAVVEAFIMVITFEALREAGIRLPKAVGQSVSIVGALVIGDAAVNAGIVSPGMVIVVALTGVASFSIPSYDLAMTNRLLQVPFMLLAGFFGLYGITVGLFILLAHLVSLRSFGVPYMSPLAPLDSRALREDSFFRSPWWSLQTRPAMLEPVNSIENASPKPQPEGGGKS